jgi:hypothetical protein
MIVCTVLGLHEAYKIPFSLFFSITDACFSFALLNTVQLTWSIHWETRWSGCLAFIGSVPSLIGLLLLLRWDAWQLRGRLCSGYSKFRCLVHLCSCHSCSSLPGLTPKFTAYSNQVLCSPCRLVCNLTCCIQNMSVVSIPSMVKLYWSLSKLCGSFAFGKLMRMVTGSTYIEWRS